MDPIQTGHILMFPVNHAAFYDPGAGAVDPLKYAVAPLEAGTLFVDILDFRGFHGPCVQLIRFDFELW